MPDNVTEHPCTALLHAAERVIAVFGDEEQMPEALMDLAVAVDQLRRRVTDIESEPPNWPL